MDSLIVFRPDSDSENNLRLRDWYIAKYQLARELGREPSESEIRARANEIWLKRKDSDELCY